MTPRYKLTLTDVSTGATLLVVERDSAHYDRDTAGRVVVTMPAPGTVPASVGTTPPAYDVADEDDGEAP